LRSIAIISATPTTPEPAIRLSKMMLSAQLLISSLLRIEHGAERAADARRRSQQDQD